MQTLLFAGESSWDTRKYMQILRDICEEEDGTYAALSSWNFEFLKLHFKNGRKAG